MPQVSKGARLYPYKRKGRPAIYFIRDGEYFRSTGFTLEQRDAANEALAAYIRGKKPNTNRTDTSKIWVAEVLTLYVQDQPPDKPSKALIGYHVKALEPYWGDKKLSDVKGSTCREYCARRVGSLATASLKTTASQAKPVKPSTARRELKTLSAAINHWHKESPLEAVPQVTLPVEGKSRERVLEHREAVAMLRACRRRKLAYVERFILIGLYTGTRHDAILKLRWKAALSGGHIDLQRGVLYRRGSAERETSKRRPPVQIRGKLHRLFQGWAKQDAKSEFSHVIHFKGQSIAKMRKAWDTIRTEAKLGEEVTPHVLRHTCATWNLRAGLTIWDVAGLIGADASTVERVYGHHLIKQERKKA